MAINAKYQEFINGEYVTKHNETNDLMVLVGEEKDKNLRTKLAEIDSAIANCSGGGGGLTPNAEVETLKVTQSATIGATGGFAAPNYNNLYIPGSLYMGDKDSIVTHPVGPGSVGGNIYLPAGKAICGLTKDGVKEGDSGVRTIGFVGQATEEDQLNNETSVYIGTDASRLYLYSKTAYPTVVSNREVLAASLEPMSESSEVETKESVRTVSPIATQEWVLGLLTSLGLIGGGEDKTNYIAADKNTNNSFDLANSKAWNQSFSTSWQLSNNGNIGHLKMGGKQKFACLFQSTGWNEFYFAIPPAQLTQNYYVSYKTPQYAYAIRFSGKLIYIALFDYQGNKIQETTTVNDKSFDDIASSSSVMRLKYDDINRNIVISGINNANEETIIAVLSEYTFSHLNEFDKREQKFGVVANVSNTVSTIITVVNRPSGFDPTQKAYTDNSVLRVRDMNMLNLNL